MQRKLIIPLALAVTAAAIGALEHRRQPSATASSPQQPQARAIDNEVCSACHVGIAESFHRTGMGRSLYRPAADNVIEDYTEYNQVDDPRTNLHYRMVQEGDSFYQIEYRQDAAGQRIHERRHQVEYIIGSGNHNRAYVWEESGYLYQMPIAWYSQVGRWDLSPGYHSQNSRFDRPIIEECVQCHNADTPFSTDSEHHYPEHLPLGIACERCHAPGARHVDLRAAGNGPPAGVPDSTIVNPRRLPPQRQMDVCLQCHLVGSVRFPLAGADNRSFHAGERLADHRAVFVSKTTQLGDLRITSHGERFVQSACYSQTRGALTCITCHNPHEPVAEVPRQRFNAVCIGCHAADPPPSPRSTCQRHAPNAASDDCVGCHMRQGGTTDARHVNFTDHWIRPPSDGATASTPSASTELRAFFPDTTALAPMRLGIAYMRLYEARERDSDHLERAGALLGGALSTTPSHVEGRYALARVLTHLRDTAQAERLLANLIADQPDHGRAHFQLGALLAARGANAAAAGAYRAATQFAPELFQAHMNLGNALAALGDSAGAWAAYAKARELQPHNADVHLNRGRFHLTVSGNLEAAGAAYARALHLAPDQADAWQGVGAVALARGEYTLAAKRLAHAVQLSPGYAPAYGNLALAHLALGDSAAAETTLERLLEFRPSDRRAMQLLRRLRSPGD